MVLRCRCQGRAQPPHRRAMLRGPCRRGRGRRRSASKRHGRRCWRRRSGVAWRCTSWRRLTSGRGDRERACQRRRREGWSTKECSRRLARCAGEVAAAARPGEGRTVAKHARDMDVVEGDARGDGGVCTPYVQPSPSDFRAQCGPLCGAVHTKVNAQVVGEGTHCGGAERMDRVEERAQRGTVALAQRQHDACARFHMQAGGAGPIRESAHDKGQGEADGGEGIGEVVGRGQCRFRNTGRAMYQRIQRSDAGAKIVPESGRPRCTQPLKTSIVVAWATL